MNWQCVGNTSAPLARINAKVACMSTDGENCLWDTCQGGKLVGRIPSNLKPAVCSGNEPADHWCSQGQKLLNLDNIRSSGSSSKPVSPSVVLPKERSSSNGRDYFFYVIDMIVSIIAISIALITTADQDYSVKIVHIVLAILFRYVYLGYSIITKGRALFFI